LDTVESNTNTAISNLNSRVATEESTRSTADAAAASRLTTVEATAAKVRVFRQSTPPTAYFVGDQWYDTGNGNKLKVWNGSAWADTDDVRIAATAAAVTTETTARISGDSALASQVTSLSTTVGGHTTSISNIASSLNGTQGRYGITIDNNGFVTGFSLLSDTSNGNPTSVSQHKAVKAIVMTHMSESTKALFDMCKRYFDNCPAALKPSTKYSSRKELSFDKLDSSYMVATAGGEGIGRGETLQLAHLSEAAFYPPHVAKDNINGLMQAIPNARGAYPRAKRKPWRPTPQRLAPKRNPPNPKTTKAPTPPIKKAPRRKPRAKTLTNPTRMPAKTKSTPRIPRRPWVTMQSSRSRSTAKSWMYRSRT
jgi:hypothetical protein